MPESKLQFLPSGTKANLAWLTPLLLPLLLIACIILAAPCAPAAAVGAISGAAGGAASGFAYSAGIGEGPLQIAESTGENALFGGVTGGIFGAGFGLVGNLYAQETAAFGQSYATSAEWSDLLASRYGAENVSGGEATALRDRVYGNILVNQTALASSNFDTLAVGSSAASRGGIARVLQGQAGVGRAIAEIESQGGTVLGREITVEAGGVRTRPDLLVQNADGSIEFVEVKNGPGAGLTPNQTTGFAAIQAGGAVPRGANAAAAGLQLGVPLPPTPVRVTQYP